ncbi:MAG: hypothetical protein J6Q69_01900, partial [Clostridia bacterium]|nr:hypothetical protein [Clostridia bacterium]
YLENYLTETLPQLGIALIGSFCMFIAWIMGLVFIILSMKNGGKGYCGVMANFHPALYAYLCENFEKEPEKVEQLQALLCMTGFTESLQYPLTAKYNMCLEGMETCLTSRSRAGEVLSEYGKSCVRQMKLLCDETLKKLG